MDKIKKIYSMSEIVKNFISLIYTKIFFKRARLIRLPIVIRGSKRGIKYGNNLTVGYRNRFDIVKTENEKDATKIEIGNNCTMGDDCHIAAYKKVKIGDDVLIASKVFISDLNHGIYDGQKPTSPEIPPNQRSIYSKKIVIENNVWIGENVAVLQGVTIGEGSVIGANSVVTKDIDKYSIAVGNPAKVIKKYDFKSKEWKKV